MTCRCPTGDRSLCFQLVRVDAVVSELTVLLHFDFGRFSIEDLTGEGAAAIALGEAGEEGEVVFDGGDRSGYDGALML